MIAGLPVSTWVLLLVAIGLPLTIELLFFVAQRRGREARRRASHPVQPEPRP